MWRLVVTGNGRSRCSICSRALSTMKSAFIGRRVCFSEADSLRLPILALRPVGVAGTVGVTGGVTVVDPADGTRNIWWMPLLLVRLILAETVWLPTVAETR